MINPRCSVVVAALATLAFGHQAVAQSYPKPTPSQSSTAPIVEASQAAIRAQKALIKSVPQSKSVAEELSRRASLDQMARQIITVIAGAGLSAGERNEVMTAVWKEIEAIDADNTAYVKSVLPADGWFRQGRDGVQASRDAWLIVQHSTDRAFQSQVAAAMGKLVAIGEANGPNYALLYDRTEMHAGRPQRFGSQASCKDGIMTIHTLEDPAKVDELRRSVGLTQPLAEYSSLLGVGKAC